MGDIMNISLAPGFVTVGLIFQSILTNTWDGILPSTLPIVGLGLIAIYKADQNAHAIASVISICISLYYLTYFISLVSGIPHDSNFPIILIIFLSILLVIVVGYGYFPDVDEKMKITEIIRTHIGSSVAEGVGAALAILTIPCGLGYGLAQLARKFGLNFFPDKDGKSKNVKCTRPATQAFKCTVYKNGKPVGDIMD